MSPSNDPNFRLYLGELFGPQEHSYRKRCAGRRASLSRTIENLKLTCYECESQLVPNKSGTKSICPTCDRHLFPDGEQGNLL